MSHRHKKVLWKTDRTVDSPARPVPYMGDTTVPPDRIDDYERCLYAGALFIVKKPLITATLGRGYSPPPHPFLVESIHAFSPTVWDGSIAIYSSIVRVEEQHRGLRDGGIVRVPRHSFIISGTKYLITNLALVDPVIEVTSEEVSETLAG